MIFYFSCTGNTRWAAQKTAEALGERLIDMAACLKEEHPHFTLDENENVGWFFPVHGWRPPVAVRKFMERMTINNISAHYCYALCTAGDTVGEAMDRFEALATTKGIHIDSAFSLIMPESYVGLPFMDVDTHEMEMKKKEEADLMLDTFIKHIRNRHQHIRQITVGRWPKINSRLIGHVFEKWLIDDKPFHVDTDKCTGCGICASVCPMDDIKMTDHTRSNGNKRRLPQWQHNGSCLTCFACYHHCPQKALAFGKRTKGKGQYYFERNVK